MPEADSSSISTKAEHFINLLSRCYRLWEWIIVFVGVFYAVTTPFFVCFASDMVTLEGNTPEEDDTALDHWERIVLCIDVLCLADLAIKHSAFRRVLRLSAGAALTSLQQRNQPQSRLRPSHLQVVCAH